MSNPSKKRKLNAGSESKAPSRGLEYFFAKQQKPKKENSDDVISKPLNSTANDAPLTDEELARKLQAEFDREANLTSRSSSFAPPNIPAESLLVPVAQPDATDPTPSDIVAPKPAPLELETPKPAPNKTLALQSATNADDKPCESLPLDESPLSFDSQAHLHNLSEQWKSQKDGCSYSLLVRCFVLINGTTSRIRIVDTLVNCLRIIIEGDPSSLLPAVWLATNAIAPPYESMELGLGGSAISKALRTACGLDARALKSLYDKHGDAGDVAFEAKKKQSFTLRKPQPLTIKGVYASLVKIATTKGQGSAQVKQSIVDKMLQNARGGEESRYIVRTLSQHLRIGAVKTTMLIALSRAFLLSKPPGAEYTVKNREYLASLKKEYLAEIWSSAEQLIKSCFARRPNYADIIPHLLEIGVTDELALRCCLTLHTPLRPMLGSITRDLSEMLTKLQNHQLTCEFKYDGQRAQVHCDASGKVTIFSRHLELMTDKYPDLVALIPQIRGEGVSSFIMEGEVVAVDSLTGELRNFQALSNRARKDVEIGSVTVQVCLFAFDLMFLNGESLLSRDFRERRELLRSLFVQVPQRFTWVKNIDATSSDSESVLDFFKSAIESKCEGIMVKILDTVSPIEDASSSAMEEGKTKDDEKTPKPRGRRKPLLATYEPDRRLESWLKVKKDYSSSFDTLDLIPVAAWHGSGRKAKWWSPILMAVRNEETGSLEAVCKCMSGFSDVFYKENRAVYNDGEDGSEPQNTRTTQPAFVEYLGPRPDVWFEPHEVWEMGFADITLSPTYSAAIGLVSDERGLSLRFPRFIKKREDKSMEEASTNSFLASLFHKQEATVPRPLIEEDEEEEGD
ncbi:hypothetical protein TD95_000266 [Thielaviopsis punctulata]|uniref:DNA ligase n=1 Tax=Thielaviopsis punctulata TaxID=72032 RepID=A0A0F4ZEC1_9PEZI|nr:hypothetical protein TD95_000266 [Thielaviopsis punctulata]